MAQSEPPPDVAESFEMLSTASVLLNVVSDELGKSITALDEALKRLNLGVPTWVPVKHYEDPDGGEYTRNELGYAKIGSKWGIALRTVVGNEYREVVDSWDEWLFNEAPRDLRIEAVEKLPALLAGLTSAALATADRIKGKIVHARQVVEAVNAASKAIESRTAAQRRK